jgi:hypothetical protein
MISHKSRWEAGGRGDRIEWSGLIAQSTYFPRDETGLVCLPTQLERTLVMVNVKRGGGYAPPTLTSQD